MPRRGWSVIATPSGWFEVIRGPRPPAVQWPIVSKGQGKGKGTKKPATAVAEPRKVQSKLEPKGHVASIEAAIRALGSNPEPTVLASFKEALQKAKDIKEPKPAREAVSRSPDEVRADAVARVASLEAAIAAFEDHHDQAPEVARGSSRESQEKCQRGSSWCEVELIDEVHRAPSEEVDNKGRRDFQEGRGASAIAVLTRRGDGKFGRGRSKIGVSKG